MIGGLFKLGEQTETPHHQHISYFLIPVLLTRMACQWEERRLNFCDKVPRAQILKV